MDYSPCSGDIPETGHCFCVDSFLSQVFCKGCAVYSVTFGDFIHLFINDVIMFV